MPNDSKFFRGFDKYWPSAIALVVANLLPLLGVLFLKWDTFSIVALYWVENVIIGAINVLKMIVCSPQASAINWDALGTSKEVVEFRRQFEQSDAEEKAKLLQHGGKFFLAPFFIFHYGLFCFVHGVFVFALFGRDDFGPGFGPFGPLDNIVEVFREQHLWWAVAVLAASHLYSFFVNFIGRGEYQRTFVTFLMGQPYARVIILHLAILFGGFISMALGSNIGVLAILVLGKTAVDLHFHLQERMSDAAQTMGQGPAPDILDEMPAAQRRAR